MRKVAPFRPARFARWLIIGVVADTMARVLGVAWRLLLGMSNAPLLRSGWWRHSLELGVSALVRTWGGILLDYGGAAYNPMHPAFAAVGGGTVDDTAAIQAAFDAAADRNGFPVEITKVHKTTDTLTMQKGQIVRGSGRNSGQLVHYGDNDCLYALDTEAADIVVMDLQIVDGLGIATRTAGHGIHLTAVGIGARFVLDRVHISGFYHSFCFGDAGYGELRNCRALSPKKDGFHFATGQHTIVTMTSCGSTGAGQHGLYGDGCSHFTFNSCFMDSSTKKGWYLLNGRECVFNACSGEENIEDAYYLYICQHFTFNGCSGSRESTVNAWVFDSCSRIVLNAPLCVSVTGYGFKCVGSNHDIMAWAPRFDSVGTADVLDTDGAIQMYKDDAFVRLTLGRTKVYADLPAASQYFALNSFYIITDCNTTVIGATAAGSGSNRVLVVSDGSNWKVLAAAVASTSFVAATTVDGEFLGLSLTNSSAGTAAFLRAKLQNDATSSYIYLFGSGYSSSGLYYADGVNIEVNGAGGLVLNAKHASGDMSLALNSVVVQKLDHTALADGDTYLFLRRKAGGTENLRRVQWKDGASITAGDKVMIFEA